VAETNGLEQPTLPAVSGGLVQLYQLTQRLEQESKPMNQQLVRAFSSLSFDEEGQTLVEYALILVLVSIAAVTLLSSIGAFPSSVFSHLNADF
jgi:Flp pilus assembly pilin Flp